MQVRLAASDCLLLSLGAVPTLNVKHLKMRHKNQNIQFEFFYYVYFKETFIEEIIINEFYKYLCK